MWPLEIYVHHSLTKDGKEVSWGAIRYYHMTAPEYLMKDIGYHAGIELVASGDHQYYEALMGRMWTEQGAHARGHNVDTLGICFIGNYDLVAPPEEMLVKGAQVVALWMRIFRIPPDKIFPHSAVDPKTCPGKLFPMPHLVDLCVETLEKY